MWGGRADDDATTTRHDTPRGGTLEGATPRATIT